MVRNVAPGHISRVTVVVLLIVFPGLLSTFRHLHPAPPPSPQLDRFLDAVRAITPANTRLIIASNTGGLTFFRATYLLYPRRIYSAQGTNFTGPSPLTPSMSWQKLVRLAKNDYASYILTWDYPIHSRDTIRFRMGAGLMIAVTR